MLSGCLHEKKIPWKSQCSQRCFFPEICYTKIISILLIFIYKYYLWRGIGADEKDSWVSGKRGGPPLMQWLCFINKKHTYWFDLSLYFDWLTLMCYVLLYVPSTHTNVIWPQTAVHVPTIKWVNFSHRLTKNHANISKTEFIGKSK